MSKKFKMNKVNVHELSQTQVKEIVIEMINLMKISWKIKNKNDLESQKKFKKILYENLYKKILNITSMLFTAITSLKKIIGFSNK